MPDGLSFIERSDLQHQTDVFGPISPLDAFAFLEIFRSNDPATHAILADITGFVGLTVDTSREVQLPTIQTFISEENDTFQPIPTIGPVAGNLAPLGGTLASPLFDNRDDFAAPFPTTENLLAPDQIFEPSGTGGFLGDFIDLIDPLNLRSIFVTISGDPTDKVLPTSNRTDILESSTPTQSFAGGIPMVTALIGQAAPRLILAFRAAAALTNRAGALRLGPITGRGAFQAAIGALGIKQLWDVIDGDPSKADQLQDLVEELLDSGYILWDTHDRRGQERRMEYIVVPVGQNAAREAAYGMAYRPFSKSSIRKHDEKQDTYKRPRRAARRPQGRR